MLADTGRPGHASQAIGTAEALGQPFVVKELRWSGLAALPNGLLGRSLAGLTPGSAAAIEPPWPMLVIAAGRRTAPVARWIRGRAGACRCVQLMWPVCGYGLDLVVVPAHDRASRRSDVAVVRAMPHRLSAARLATTSARLAPQIAHLPRPLIGCLVGGSRPGAAFGAAEATALGQAASALAGAAGGSLLVTTSRRTGGVAEQALSRCLSGPHRLHLARDTGLDTYSGIVGSADGLIVTAESGSLLAEACAAGRPVRLFRPAGWRLGKLDRLHRTLAAWIRPLDAPFRPEALPRLDTGGEVARLVEALLAMSPAQPHVLAAMQHESMA